MTKFWFLLIFVYYIPCSLNFAIIIIIIIIIIIVSSIIMEPESHFAAYVWQLSLCSPGWPGTCMIFMLRAPEDWDYRSESPWLALFFKVLAIRNSVGSIMSIVKNSCLVSSLIVTDLSSLIDFLSFSIIWNSGCSGYKNKRFICLN